MNKRLKTLFSYIKLVYLVEQSVLRECRSSIFIFQESCVIWSLGAAHAIASLIISLSWGPKTKTELALRPQSGPCKNFIGGF